MDACGVCRGKIGVRAYIEQEKLSIMYAVFECLRL